MFLNIADSTTNVATTATTTFLESCSGTSAGDVVIHIKEPDTILDVSVILHAVVSAVQVGSEVAAQTAVTDRR